MDNNIKKSIFRVTRFSRRQVLISAGIVTALSAMSSFVKLECKPSKGSKTAEGTDVHPPTTSVSPTSSPTELITVVTASTTPITFNTPTANATSFISYSYSPQSTLPPLIEVPGTSCMVANDRLYSLEHVWVKSLAGDMAVIGITQTMVTILDDPFKCELCEVGTMLNKDESFGNIQGWKVTADIITPVSGRVIDRNILVIGFVGEDGVISALQDHYRKAWMIVIQMTNPAELDSLLTPQQYVERVHGVESAADVTKA
jgi:glycine cleavage system H protein